jgi:hypothetical protein
MSAISNATEGASFQKYEIVYKTPVGPLKAGTNYFLTFDNTPNGQGVFVETSGNNVYPRGTYYKGSSAEPKDMQFEVHEESYSGTATVTINVLPVNDPLRIVSRQRTTNGMRIELSGPSASIYVVEASTNLVDWFPVFSSFSALGSVVFTDVANTNEPGRFYRAMSPAATNLQQNLSGGKKVAVTPGQSGAQSFRYGTAGNSDYGISRVRFWISKDSVDPSGNLLFSIGTGKGTGAIARSSVIITPSSVTNNSAGVSFQAYEIVYPEPVGPFVAGTTYYLNFTSQSANGKRYWLERSASSTYSAGTYFRAKSNFGKDIKFEILGR